MSDTLADPCHLLCFVDFAERVRLDRAVVGDSNYPRFVMVGESDQLHRAETAWLGFLQDIGRSPNTVRDYGSRVAWYLSWTALTADWRDVRPSHLALWKRTVATTPVRKTTGTAARSGDRLGQAAEWQVWS